MYIYGAESSENQVFYEIGVSQYVTRYNISLRWILRTLPKINDVESAPRNFAFYQIEDYQKNQRDCFLR